MGYDELETYKRYVAEQLTSLRSVFAKASIGDFSEEVEIPDKEDEFTELKAGVQIMIEVIRQRLSDLEQEISERKSIEEKIRYQSLHDPLTDLPNRKALEHKLTNVGNLSAAMLYLDLDHFKKVNDVLGHLAGDMLLSEFSKRLQKCVRETDFVARLGGDEFIVLLFDIEKSSDILQVVKKIFRSLQSPLRVHDQSIFLSTSIGIALAPSDGKDIWTLMANADAALLLAKQEGRNTSRFYNPQMNKRASKHLELAGELRQAMAKNQIELHYQPIIDPHKNEILNVEALVRWNHPSKGLLLPKGFLDLAEENGIMPALGEHILKLAVQDMHVWRSKGLQTLGVSINISPLQLVDTNFFAFVKETIADVPPQLFEFEIVENFAMENIHISRTFFQAAQKLGVSICVDDFGVGYSSLNYLKNFPINKLKIDRSFVRHCMASPADRAILQAMVTLGQNLGLEIVAEGVETKEQYEFLTQLGCNGLQGFYISRSMARDQLIPWATQPLKFAM
ncbi:MAG TPA: EAL domain-containing protein [Patescibacteria group bacterium]|nr:EAL domain-containing protein [Patescibacteria group bacterium]